MDSAKCSTCADRSWRCTACCCQLLSWPSTWDHQSRFTSCIRVQRPNRKLYHDGALQYANRADRIGNNQLYTEQLDAILHHLLCTTCIDYSRNIHHQSQMQVDQIIIWTVDTAEAEETIQLQQSLEQMFGIHLHCTNDSDNLFSHLVQSYSYWP